MAGLKPCATPARCGRAKALRHVTVTAGLDPAPGQLASPRQFATRDCTRRAAVAHLLPILRMADILERDVSSSGTGDCRLATVDWRVATVDWCLATGDCRLATADSGLGTWASATVRVGVCGRSADAGGGFRAAGGAAASVASADAAR